MPLILSIDGGGVRGIFAARVIARLDEARPGWRDRVRLYAGTSTGSIIAAGLADSRTPTELVELYRTQARAIFDDSFFDDLADLGRATGADYELTNLRRVLTDLFGTRLLRSLGARVLIPAVELDGQVEFGRRTVRRFKPKFFHNFRGSDSDGAEKIVDVVTRSCAAPTYFPSEQGYIDGGVVANNPSMCALAQALSRDGLNAAIDELSLISIGTGIDEVYVDAGPSGRLNWGWGQWARPLVSIMLEGSVGVAEYQCRQLLGDRYARVDAILPRRIAMDDVRASSLDELLARADEVDLRSALKIIDAA